MSPYAKFGLDRPSRSVGHRQQTNKQTYRLLLCRLAVSTQTPAADLSRCALYCLGPAGLCPPYLSRFTLEFSRPLPWTVITYVGNLGN